MKPRGLRLRWWDGPPRQHTRAVEDRKAIEEDDPGVQLTRESMERHKRTARSELRKQAVTDPVGAANRVADLEAVVERLRGEVARLQHLDYENAGLTADVERLREAGERVIAAFTTMTLREDQRMALVALGSAMEGDLDG